MWKNPWLPRARITRLHSERVPEKTQDTGFVVEALQLIT
jgi:hypothetical protein